MGDTPTSVPAGARPAGLAPRVGYEYKVAIVFLLGLFMELLDMTVVNVAIPTLQRDFQATLAGVEWLVTGYLLALAVFSPVAGFLADRTGVPEGSTDAPGLPDRPDRRGARRGGPLTPIRVRYECIFRVLSPEPRISADHVRPYESTPHREPLDRNTRQTIEPARVCGVSTNEDARAASRGRDPAVFELSDHERSLIDLLAAGLTAREIARVSGVPHATARNQVQGLLTKLDAPNRTAAVVRVLCHDVAARTSAERRLQAHHAVTRVLAETTTLAEAGPRLLAALGEQLDWEIGDVWVVDESGQVLRSAASWHRPGIEIANFVAVSLRTRFGHGVGLPGSVWASARSQWISDVTRSRTFLRRAVARAAGIHTACAFPVIRPDGEVVGVLDLLTRSVRAPDLELIAMLADIGHQIGQFVQRERIELERDRFTAAIMQSPVAAFVADATGRVVFVNPAVERLTGRPMTEIVGRELADVAGVPADPTAPADLAAALDADRPWSGDLSLCRPDDRRVQVSATASSILDPMGSRIGQLVLARDVTRERQLEVAIERQARERAAIEVALQRVEVGATLEEICSAACTQLGGLQEVDSAFVVIFEDSVAWIASVAGRLELAVSNRRLPASRARDLRKRAAAGPWSEEWRSRREDGRYGEAVTATGLHTAVYAPIRTRTRVIGVVGFGTHDRAPDRLIEHLPVLAEVGAILAALLAPTFDERRRRDDTRDRVATIVSTGSFRPFFQPIVDLHNRSVVGYEALTRFTDGTPPDVMFGMADRAGIGLELETATLAAALDAAVVLPPRAYLSLNVSPALIVSDALAPLLAGCERPITLEVTEHVVVEDYAELRAALTALGPDVRLAVDDAGSGYASLRHILELAPDYVKLDLGFVRGIDTDPARQALIAGMAYFAVKRKIRLVAEGIETTAQLETLRDLAIPYGQGYLLGRPQDGRGPGPWPATIALPRHR